MTNKIFSNILFLLGIKFDDDVEAFEKVAK